MFGFLKRKKKKEEDKDRLKESLNKALSKTEKEKNLKTTLDKELAKEKKRKKKPKGPNWPAFAALVLCFVIGLFFLIYGRMQRQGVQGLIPEVSILETETTTSEQAEDIQKKPLPINSDGVIIFEKRTGS